MWANSIPIPTCYFRAFGAVSLGSLDNAFRARSFGSFYCDVPLSPPLRVGLGATEKPLVAGAERAAVGMIDAKKTTDFPQGLWGTPRALWEGPRRFLSLFPF